MDGLVSEKGPVSDQTTLAGGKPASPIGQISWALYEWARNPYFILVNIYIFAPYFTNVVVGDPVRGQELWGYTSSVGGIILAMIGPVVGAIADAGGRRKPWVFLCTFAGAPMMACLWFATPGMGEAVTPMLLVVIVIGLLFELSVIFHNAMLPALAARGRVGGLSGLSLALGNAAGVLLFVFVLFAWEWAEHPLFGLDRARFEPERAIGLLTGLWFALFSLPLFFFTPDSTGTGLKPMVAARQGLRTLFHTITELRRYRNVARFVIARMIYNDGFQIILVFTGIYAAGIFGWGSGMLTIYGITLSVVAGIESFLAGLLDDYLGSRKALLISLGVGVVGALITVSISAHSILFIAVDDAKILFGLSLPEWAFILNGFLGAFGIVTGLASSRTMMARLAPPSMVGEFFGLFAFSGTATAFMGPLAVATMTGFFHSQRAGFSVVIGFLVVGGVLLFHVREEQAEA